MRPFVFATMTGAASVLAISEVMAQCSLSSISMPDPTLLTSPPEFSCEFKTATAAGQAQPGAPRDAAADAAALNAKLEHERQCYRHVRTILHERLRQLQASVSETVKTVNRACPAAVRTTRPGSRPSVPLPRRALLTAVPEVDCTFKHGSDGAGGASNPAQAAAALRTKLDYERQCYRHNGIILRADLDQLRASVGETILAVAGNERSAARGGPTAKQQPAIKQQPAARQQSAATTEQPLAMGQPAATQQPDGPRPSRAQEAPCAAFSQGKCIGRDPDPRVRSMISRDGFD
jgi:hypothetical protein